jgi:hypothetical protein
VARRPGRTEAIDTDRGPEPRPADGRPTVLLPAQAGAPDISGAHLASATPSNAEASSGYRRNRRHGRTEAAVQRDKDVRSGLASIGLADEEPLEDDLQQYDERLKNALEDDEYGERIENALEDDEYGERIENALEDDQYDERPDNALEGDQYGERPEDALEADQYDERPEQENAPGDELDVYESHVDRFDNGQSDPPTGDYWMPVPESAYAELDSAGYGWPARRDRDPAVESQPTAVVPVWPPARPVDRIELPRTWSDGAGPNLRALREVPGRRWSDANRNGGRRRQVNEDGAVRHWDQLDRDGRDGWRRKAGPEDQPDAASRRRPRPRPNPSAEARSTVYISKHAAE